MQSMIAAVFSRLRYLPLPTHSSSFTPTSIFFDAPKPSASAFTSTASEANGLEDGEGGLKIQVGGDDAASDRAEPAEGRIDETGEILVEGSESVGTFLGALQLLSESSPSLAQADSAFRSIADRSYFTLLFHFLY